MKARIGERGPPQLIENISQGEVSMLEARRQLVWVAAHAPEIGAIAIAQLVHEGLPRNMGPLDLALAAAFLGAPSSDHGEQLIGDTLSAVIDYLDLSEQSDLASFVADCSGIDTRPRS